MRKLLILTCCVGLASLVGAAEHDNDNQKNKKKGNAQAQPQQQQVVTPQTGKKYKTGPGAGPHHVQNQNFQQPGAVNYNKGNKKVHGAVNAENQTNVSSNAANTTFNKHNKSKFGSPNAVNAGGAAGAKYQKQHFNLQTNKVVNKYKTVNYNANYHIAGAHNWKGAKYQVFVNYHPQWHDTWWWNWHHPHVVSIYGGWYYWDNSYWYPAWGYAPNSIYYYDGPIYGSSPAEDPAQTVANVQTALQQQGYYSGEVDGILGPQTRAALAEYQSAQGLEPTGAVDEPTLETLGMA